MTLYGDNFDRDNYDRDNFDRDNSPAITCPKATTLYDNYLNTAELSEGSQLFYFGIQCSKTCIFQMWRYVARD